MLQKAGSPWENPNHWPVPITNISYYKIQVLLKRALICQANERVGDTMFKVLLWQ